MDRRTFLRGAAASSLLALAPGLRLPARATGLGLAAGAAATDITPETGGEFFGYVRPDIRCEGVALRLHAHALVLDDGIRKLALVTVDLGAPMVKSQVTSRIRHLGFDAETLLLAATHTHAGPNEVGDWIAHQIAEAVRLADERRRPARAGWATVPLLDANMSRSVEAHLANHGQDIAPGLGSAELDPEGPDHTRDVDLRLLRVEEADGTPLAAWAHFAAHPTTFIPANTLFSADFCGVATRRFEAGFPGPAPVAMFTNGTEGDMITWFDDYNQHAVADRIGIRVAAAMGRAWEEAGGSLSADIATDSRRTTATYQGQEVEPGKPVAAYVGYWGASFFGGAKNGPSPFYWLGTEGKRRPAALADPVHGRKILASPAPWFPTVELQAVRVGDAVLLAVPGEPTVETGRRLRAAAAAEAPAGVRDIAVVGLANGFHGYFTTPEEYDQQHYEGGHTVFGKWSSLLVQHTHAGLAAALADGRPPGPEPSGQPPSAVPPPVGDGGAGGSLLDQPASEVERMDVVDCSWAGGPEGRDRRVGDPFVTVERLRTDGDWEAVDSDLGWSLVWWERDGVYTARYDVTPDLPPGTYRFRLTSARYDLETDPFAVVPATTVRLRGVEADGDRLVFRAQNPPPEPDRNLLSRPVQPTGGSVQFRHREVDGTATWDAEAGGWVAEVAAAETGEEVEVLEGGLTDGLGNRSGAATVLHVGEVAEVDWPPAIGPAGGRTPGPFGQGGVPP